jgi:hypothetical protein
MGSRIIGMQEIRPSCVLQAVVKSGRAQWPRNPRLLAETGTILMPRTRRWMVWGLLLAAPVLLAQIAAPATHHHKSHKAQKQVVLPPLPRGPLSQLPMDQIPPSPAKVSYQNGLLTISAQNSLLGEILRDVHKLTGASIDIPPGSGANERVVTQLGPGAPRDVLVGLLNGSSFNYVMMGSSADPASVASVILTAKPSATGEVQTAANVYQTDSPPPNRFPQPMPFRQDVVIQRDGQQPGMGQAAPGMAQPGAAEADDSKDDEDNADDNADDQAQPGQPDASGGVQSMQQPDPNQQPNAGPRTPEQILEMLRRQQQQQQPTVVVNPDGQQPPQQ